LNKSFAEERGLVNETAADANLKQGYPAGSTRRRARRYKTEDSRRDKGTES